MIIECEKSLALTFSMRNRLKMPIKIRPPTYRDIRSDLQERMRTAVSSRDEYLAKAKAFDDEIDLLTRLLDQEEKRFSRKAEIGPKMLLPDFILEKLSHNEMNKEEIKVFAEHAGYFEKGESSGRSIHFTLLNLIRSGKVTTVADGIYTRTDDT